MQASPENWMAFFTGVHVLEVMASVAGIAYTVDDLDTCKVSHAMFEKLSIGNACAATLQMALVIKAAVPRAAEIKLSARLRSGDRTTVWVPQGTFWLDERGEEDGVLHVVAYDRLRMAEQDYFVDGVISGIWPKSAPEAVAEICAKLGTTLDSRTVLDDSIMVPCPVGMTVREVLCDIAAAHGGNWTMTAADQLRLVTLEDLPNKVLLGSETGDYVADENGNRIYIMAEGTCHDLTCERIRKTAEEVQISRVLLDVDDETGYTAGNADGFVLEAICTFSDQEICNNVLSVLQGVRCIGVEAENVIFDPLAELGDAAVAGGALFRIWTMELDYTTACIAELTSPLDGEVDHEFPFKSWEEKFINRKIRQAKAEIRIDLDSITQVVTGIDGRVSELKLSLAGLSSSVSGLGDQYSQLKQTVDGFEGKVQGIDGKYSKLQQTVDGWTFTTPDGTTKIKGSVIETGSLVLTDSISWGDFSTTLQESIEGMAGDKLPDYIQETYIDSTKIYSPNIMGNDIRVTGSFQTMKGGVSTGFMGAAYGLDAQGKQTNGVAISTDYNDAFNVGTNYMIVTDGGVRMQAGTHSITVTALGCYADGAKIGSGAVTAVWGA